MSSTPNVVVLLAAYNGIKWLDEQIASILNQIDVDVRLVVSVDKSSDGTEEYFKQLEKEDARVSLLPCGERFGGAGPNFYRLIREGDFTNADFISLADQDDIWYPDKLISSVQSIKDNDVSAFSSNVMAFWADGRKELINKAQPQREFDYLFESAGPGCTFVLDKTVAIELQAFCKAKSDLVDKAALHDWLIYAFVRSLGMKWFIASEPTMDYRQHENNQVGTNNNLKAYIDRVFNLKNGWYKSQALLMLREFSFSEETKQFLNKDKEFNRWSIVANISKFRRRFRDRVALFIFLILRIL